MNMMLGMSKIVNLFYFMAPFIATRAMIPSSERLSEKCNLSKSTCGPGRILPSSVEEEEIRCITNVHYRSDRQDSQVAKYEMLRDVKKVIFDVQIITAILSLRFIYNTLLPLRL